MLINLRNIWRPDNYHGWGKRAPFFEGWYFKLVDVPGSHAHAIIPGVFVGSDPDSSHCFVQVLDSAKRFSSYHRYPLGAFSAGRERFDIRIGPNRFLKDRICLGIDTSEKQVCGELRFRDLSPWPVSFASPGIMGWYALVPFMECYHGVVSLDHAIEGKLEIDGETVDFTGGRGYTEKDWGQAFPKAWVWMQSNHFESTGTSFTASVATIPWVRSEFDGFIVGLLHEQRLYRFATYTGAEIERLEVGEDRVVFHVTDRRRHRLEIVGERAEGATLRAPQRTAMLGRVTESLSAAVSVRLINLRSSETVFAGTGRHAGLEVSGELKPVNGNRVGYPGAVDAY